MIRTLALTAALLLAACGSTPQQIVFEARSGYDAAILAPAANYNELPRCPAEPVCSEQSVVTSLRKADAAAKTALDAAEDAVRNHPDWDSEATIDAMQSAIEAVRQILLQYKVI
jgi:hypothetical protein